MPVVPALELAGPGHAGAEEETGEVVTKRDESDDTKRVQLPPHREMTPLVIRLHWMQHAPQRPELPSSAMASAGEPKRKRSKR